MKQALVFPTQMIHVSSTAVAVRSKVEVVLRIRRCCHFVKSRIDNHGETESSEQLFTGGICLQMATVVIPQGDD
jgi:hypothetical protein